MVPTLTGRWHTRIFLMGTFGVLVTLFFGYLYEDFQTPLALLGYVLMIGLIGDILYDYAQTWRWDYDWPPFLHLLTGILEGAAVWILSRLVDLPGVSQDLTFTKFLAHYATVFTVLYLVMWNAMKVLFPWWRFRGGRVV